MNAVDIIKNYKKLLDDGIINQDDFEAKKKELLATGQDAGDRVDLLKAYKELLDTGVITQEEFDLKKKSFLAQVTQAPGAAAAAPTGAFMPNAGATGTYAANAFQQNVRATGTIPTGAMPQYAYPPNAGAMNPGARSANLQKSSAKIKKVLTGVIIGVVAIAVIAVAASMFGGGSFKKLPGGVKMGDSRSTVMSKSSKLKPTSTDSGKYYYEVSHGEAYGYSFDYIDYWFNSNDQLNEIWIGFSDPDLDISKLEKKLSKVYGKASYDDGEYYWDAKDVDIYAGAGSTRLYVYIYSKVY